MGKINRFPDYSDLDLDFIPHPTTGDLVKKTGVEAIKRSVRNLVLTNFYEKPFRPGVGSNAVKLLFDNMNPLTANFLRQAIEEVIQNYEPRVEVQQVSIVESIDSNGYDATIAFTIINRNLPIVISLFLERIR